MNKSDKSALRTLEGTQYQRFFGQFGTKPHYEDVDGCLYFYGGEFSNFVGGPYTLGNPHYTGYSPDINRWSDYRTVEHWYQACKATNSHDHELIRRTTDTWEAKAIGQEIELRDDWEIAKLHVMLNGLRIKFNDSEFWHPLLETENLYLAEDSPTDFVWGIRDENGGYTGRNLLGVALMLIRDKTNGRTDAHERAIATVMARNDKHSETDRAMLIFDQKMTSEQD